MSGIMKSSLFFAKKVGSYSDGWGEVTAEDRTWEQLTGIDGHTTKSYVPPTALTAPAPAAGRFMLKTESSSGKHRKRITRPRLPAYRITNLAAARAVQATLGICTLLPALNIL